ncbi:HTTM domain-containing protein [Microbacterium sp. CFH 90308]|uniref:HTTM domain-containing protein n=1 Tax=Microbacterium salsuginis TaxID=2722803 RepID=A0ABX1KB73_9MICO|nr:HTTM domain-containing protein [Microbacterium sp. CFH 90308]NLP84281.1 HTTM domain-containing protein [Microbacterium sp. CFH 90308]
MTAETTTDAAGPATTRERIAAALDPRTVWQRFVTWLTAAQRATVSFSLLRILFGLAMLIVLIPSMPDRHYLWGVGSWWVEPEASRRGWWEPLRLLFSKESMFWFDLAYAVLLVLVVLFLVGLKTRWVTPLLLIFWVGLSTNSTLLTNGGDTLMRIVLLFVIFANLSEHFSVDAWLRRRSAKRGRTPRSGPAWLPRWLVNWAHNTVLILCVFQILLVYLVSSVLKLTGEEWLEGTAIYYALRIDEFRVFPMISDLVWQFTPAIVLGSWLALWVQLLLPILVIWRPTRYTAVALITGMHLGIAVLLSLWPFSLAMIALDLLLVRDASWRRVGAWFAATGRGVRRAVTDPGRGGTAPGSRPVGAHTSHDAPSIDEPLGADNGSDLGDETVPARPSELQPAGRLRSGSAIRR